MKMLEDLAEVVRYADDPSSRTDAAFVSALRFIRTHHAAILDMAKRLEAAERDAAKYRWLLSKAYVGVNLHKECLWSLRGIYDVADMSLDDLADEAIDAAMQETGR